MSEKGEVFGKQQPYRTAIDAPDSGKRMGGGLLMLAAKLFAKSPRAFPLCKQPAQATKHRELAIQRTSASNLYRACYLR
ncbi:hypothetical protein B7486_51995 [cyanobacterium TDX16]|nr:hypothetical protein B7486_51995 [cyanobacterium TDX16]